MWVRGPQLQIAGIRRRRLAAVVVVVLAVLLLPALAFAHLERPSYWPNPAPDTSVSPAAGGEVPEPRSLRSALKKSPPGKTRVVCKGEAGKKSLKKLRRSLKQARKKGFRLRPSQPKKKISPKKSKKLLKLNRKLARRCKFKTVQKAVNRSSNNDRVVIMPGRYKEKPSRRAPTNDPTCADLTTVDSSGAETPSYEYQATCPNDQNLIFIQGRAVSGDAPSPPLENRHGIPDEGPCVRCNLQIEGSGVRPEDVIMDGGSGYAGKGPAAKPSDFAKHIVMRADRADGFVGRNFLLRGSKEFGFYTEETDGVLLDKVKFFWAADYGHLSFTTDHHRIQNCEGFGAGDAAVYPGAAPETGSQATSFYPDAPRINTVVRDCDLHGSVLAYSGSMGNAVRITNNHVYGNTAGISTDTISAAGHPGYPADSVEIDHNFIYSNNLHLYGPNPQVEPVVGILPVGVGIFWPGHNDGKVHDNWIFDNWRYGAMLLSVPDAVVDTDPEGAVDPGISCTTEPLVSTSCGNRFYDNHLGVAPPGFVPAKAVRDFGNNVGSTSGVARNGIDFWWDEFLGNTGNCWYDNTGPNGTRASLNADPPLAPIAGVSLPLFLPEACGTSIGLSNLVKETQLFNCFTAREGTGDPALCDWYNLPPRPASAQALRYQRQQARVMRQAAASEDGRRIEAYFDDLATRLEDSGLVDAGELDRRP